MKRSDHSSNNKTEKVNWIPLQDPTGKIDCYYNQQTGEVINHLPKSECIPLRDPSGEIILYRNPHTGEVISARLSDAMDEEDLPPPPPPMEPGPLFSYMHGKLKDQPHPLQIVSNEVSQNGDDEVTCNDGDDFLEQHEDAVQSYIPAGGVPLPANIQLGLQEALQKRKNMDRPVMPDYQPQVRQEAVPNFVIPPLRPSRGEIKYVARYSYQKQQQDELTFNKDDILTQCKDSTSGTADWTEMTDGRGDRGLVPINYIERMQPGNAAAFSPPIPTYKTEPAAARGVPVQSVRPRPQAAGHGSESDDSDFEDQKDRKSNKEFEEFCTQQKLSTETKMILNTHELTDMEILRETDTKVLTDVGIKLREALKIEKWKKLNPVSSDTQPSSSQKENKSVNMQVEEEVTFDELSEACDIIQTYIIGYKSEELIKEKRDYGSCIQGNEMVNWVVEECSNVLREDAVGMWQALFEVELIADVKGKSQFQDSKKHYYQFAEPKEKLSPSEKRSSKKNYKQMLQLLQKVSVAANKRSKLHKRSKERTDEDISVIVEMIQPLKALTEYSTVIEEVARIVKLETHVDESLVYKKGKPSDCWYIILSGSVQETIKKKPVTLTSGDDFGKPTEDGFRQGKVETKGDVCHLLRIDYNYLDDLQQKLEDSSVSDKEKQDCDKDEFEEFCNKCKITDKTKNILIENEYLDLEDLREATTADLRDIGISMPQIKKIQKFLQEEEDRKADQQNKQQENNKKKTAPLQQDSSDDEEENDDDDKDQSEDDDDDDEDSDDSDMQPEKPNKNRQSSSSNKSNQSAARSNRTSNAQSSSSEEDDDDENDSKGRIAQRGSAGGKDKLNTSGKNFNVREESDSESTEKESEEDEPVAKMKSSPGRKPASRSLTPREEDVKSKLKPSSNTSRSTFRRDSAEQSNYSEPKMKVNEKKPSQYAAPQSGKASIPSAKSSGKPQKRDKGKGKDKFYQIAGEEKGLLAYLKRLVGFGKKPSTQTVGEFTVYKMPLLETYRDEKSRIRFCQIGSSEPQLTPKTILLVGKTGSGKSTMIEGMVNYLYGIEFETQYRLSLIDLQKSEQKKNMTISQTDWITAYLIPSSKFTITKYPLIIIDMPGFGDTRGFERDEELVKNLTTLFKTGGEGGINSIDAVCFVAAASDPRLTPEQHYIFNSILSIFGKDIKENIHALISFVDNPDTQPLVIDGLAAAKVPVNTYFKFNNDAVYPKKKSVINEAFWEMGITGYKDFFEHLDDATPKSLTLTVETLQERNEINNIVFDLQKKIEEKVAKIKENERMEKELQENMIQRAESEGFEVTIPEDRFEKVKTKPGEYIIYCTTCKHECQLKSPIKDDADIEGSVLMEEGNCVACKKHCSWKDHTSRNYTERKTKVYIQTISQEKKDIFHKAEKSIVEIEAKLDPIREERDALISEVNDLYGQVTKCMKRLDKIALKKSPPSKLEYLNILIKQQEMESSDGSQGRIAMLQEMVKREETIMDIAQKKADKSGKSRTETEI